MPDFETEVAQRATTRALPEAEKERLLGDFATAYRWQPTDVFTSLGSDSDSLTNGHLLVEYGLDYAGVVTLLHGISAFDYLPERARQEMLALSYNNLVDWHFFVTSQGIWSVNNRTFPVRPALYSFAKHKNIAYSDSFRTLTSADHPTNVPNLETSLLETISHWRKVVKADLDDSVTTGDISSLFNTIIFLRAAEDDAKRRGMADPRARLLALLQREQPEGALSELVSKAFRKLRLDRAPFVADGLSLEALQVVIAKFDRLEAVTVAGLFSAFYKHDYVPYHYDFGIISKHALSKIYEKYVVELAVQEGPRTLFPTTLATEVEGASTGVVYTPQYVARFLLRAVKDAIAPKLFRKMRVLDPACGSGIFLRTILELRIDPKNPVDRVEVRRSFSEIEGWDVDANACNAARLSLSLFYLAAFGEVPTWVKIVQQDSLAYVFDPIQDGRQETFGLVIANPPFVKYDRLNEAGRAILSKIFGEDAGKSDLYLAFLKLGTTVVEEDGFICFVLPHNFLVSKNAGRLRADIADAFDIHYLVDLSQIDVFEAVGAYVILLVARRRRRGELPHAPCTLVKIREQVGTALQCALLGEEVEGDAFSVTKVNQSHFKQGSWQIVRRSERNLESRLSQHPTLDQLADIRLGYISGYDKVFFQQEDVVPKEERSVWQPLLRDREMTFMTVPGRTRSRAFYPFGKDEGRLDEKAIRKGYPWTWGLLLSHKKELSERRSVTSGNCQWWEPVRPRLPKNILRPKVVCPHLMLIPRFSLDVKGAYLVSHSVYLLPPHGVGQADILEYLMVMLNHPVTFWQIQQRAHKYSKGYVRLEPMTLKQIRVPSPQALSTSDMRLLKRTVEDVMAVDDPYKKARESLGTLWDIATKAYGIPREVQEQAGIDAW